MHMEVKALFGRFFWCGVNIDDVTKHPSRGSRINPTLKQDSTTGKFCLTKESACGIICRLRQQTSPKRWFANAKMTSYYDDANSLYALTMIPIRGCSIFFLFFFLISFIHTLYCLIYPWVSFVLWLILVNDYFFCSSFICFNNTSISIRSFSFSHILYIQGVPEVAHHIIIFFFTI